MKKEGAQAWARLDALPPDGPHGAVLAERQRFGPPETWKGWRQGMGPVAVKLYPHDLPMPPHLELMARFRHDGVAPLLDWGAGWTVHAWVEGNTLAARLRHAPLTEHELAAITQAVRALHRAGLPHGDLTPANIILAAWGPVLIDWGEETLGTPGWRPSAPFAPSTPFEKDLYGLERLATLIGKDPIPSGDNPGE